MRNPPIIMTVVCPFLLDCLHDAPPFILNFSRIGLKTLRRNSVPVTHRSAWLGVGSYCAAQNAGYSPVTPVRHHLLSSHTAMQFPGYVNGLSSAFRIHCPNRARSSNTPRLAHKRHLPRPSGTHCNACTALLLPFSDMLFVQHILHIMLHHQLHQIIETSLRWVPPQHSLGLGGVAQERFYLCRAKVPGVNFH